MISVQTIDCRIVPPVSPLLPIADPRAYGCRSAGGACQLIRKPKSQSVSWYPLRMAFGPVKLILLKAPSQSIFPNLELPPNTWVSFEHGPRRGPKWQSNMASQACSRTQSSLNVVHTILASHSLSHTMAQADMVPYGCHPPKLAGTFVRLTVLC